MLVVLVAWAEVFSCVMQLMALLQVVWTACYTCVLCVSNSATESSDRHFTYNPAFTPNFRAMLSQESHRSRYRCRTC